MKHQNEKMQVKGTVLVTVMTVMFIMVMFLMSTLVLTTSANRRSYYTYFETQAQFAAQAALDAITNNAYTSQDFKSFVDDLAVKGEDGKVTYKTGTFKVKFDNDTDIPLKEDEDNNKYVTCTISKCEDNFVWDPKANHLYKQPGWKISATAEVGHARNTSSFTAVNYLYSNALDGVASDIPLNSWQYDYMIKIGKQGESGETINNENQNSPITKHACVSLSNMPADNLASIGDTASGIYEYPDGRGRYRHEIQIHEVIKHQYWTEEINGKKTIQNDAVVYGQKTYINSNEIGGARLTMSLVQGQGAVFMGDLTDQSTKLVVISDALVGTHVTSFKNTPYIYIDGKAEMMHGSIGAVKYDNGVKYPKTNYNINGDNSDLFSTTPVTSPVNFIAGAYRDKDSKDSMFYGNVILFESGNPNGTAEGREANYNQSSFECDENPSKIGRFVEQNLTKSNLPDGTVGGNFVCNNAKLTINGNFKCGGDFLFSNPGGTIELNGKITAQGAVVINAAEISGNNSEIIADGGVFINPKTKISAGMLKVKGGADAKSGDSVNYDTLGNATDGCKVTEFNKTTPSEFTQSKTSAYIPTLGKQYSGKDFKSLCEDVMTGDPNYPADYTSNIPSASYDFRVFPYFMRPDEIWDEYVRWDIYGKDGKQGFPGNTEGENEAKTYRDNAKTKDALLAESIAAGHKYNVVAKSGKSARTDTDGTRNFLYTTSEKNNNFIPKIETVSKADSVKNLGYQDTFANMQTNFGTIKEMTAKVTIVDPTQTDENGNFLTKEIDRAEENIKLICHDENGNLVTEKEDSEISAYVINQQCAIEVKSGKKYFIDPTAGGHTETNPLVVAMYGTELDNVQIVVNNSAIYKIDKTGSSGEIDYTRPFPYGASSDDTVSYANNNPTKNVSNAACCDDEYTMDANGNATGPLHASRADVIIYLMNTEAGDEHTFDPKGGGLVDIHPSGAHAQLRKNHFSYQVNCDFPDGVVHNVTVDGKTTTIGNSWSKATTDDKATKFKYEMLPNVVFFTGKGSLGLEASTIWGAFVSPTTKIAFDTGSAAKQSCDYRVNKTDPLISTATSGNDFKGIMLVGSICCEKLSANNWRNVVFAGNVPSYSSGSTPGQDYYTSSGDGGNSNSPGLNRGGKLFDNDHMGQG